MTRLGMASISYLLSIHGRVASIKRHRGSDAERAPRGRCLKLEDTIHLPNGDFLPKRGIFSGIKCFRTCCQNGTQGCALCGHQIFCLVRWISAGLLVELRWPHRLQVRVPFLGLTVVLDATSSFRAPTLSLVNRSVGRRPTATRVGEAPPRIIGETSAGCAAHRGPHW